MLRSGPYNVGEREERGSSERQVDGRARVRAKGGRVSQSSSDPPADDNDTRHNLHRRHLATLPDLPYRRSSDGHPACRQILRQSRRKELLREAPRLHRPAQPPLLQQQPQQHPQPRPPLPSRHLSRLLRRSRTHRTLRMRSLLRQPPRARAGRRARAQRRRPRPDPPLPLRRTTGRPSGPRRRTVRPRVQS
jgi:hypothetical protein